MHTRKWNFFNLVHVVGESVYLLSTTVLNWSVGCNGTQRHGGEHGAEEGNENDKERLPHPRISHDVEETQKNKHTCEETDWWSCFQTSSRSQTCAEPLYFIGLVEGKVQYCRLYPVISQQDRERSCHQAALTAEKIISIYHIRMMAQSIRNTSLHCR